MANKKEQIKFSISPEVAMGKAVNHFRITGSVTEFILDFAKRMPDLEVTPIISRITLAPLGVKVLAKILNDSVKEYEEKFGRIQDDLKMLNFEIDTEIKN